MITAIWASGAQLPSPIPEGAVMVVVGGQWRSTTFGPQLFEQQTQGYLGDLGDFDPGDIISTFMISAGAPGVTIRGVLAKLTGRRIRFIDTAGQPLTLKHNDGTVPVTDRLFCPGGVDLVLGFGGVADIEYSIALGHWVVTQ